MSHGILKQRIVFFARFDCLLKRGISNQCCSPPRFLRVTSSYVKPALVTSKISLTVCFRNKRKNFTNKTKNLFPITRRRPRNLVWQFLQVKLCLFHLNCWFAGDVTAAMLDCWWCVGRQNKSWHVDSSTTNVAALSRGCKPRILRWNRCFLFSNAKSFVTLFSWYAHK